MAYSDELPTYGDLLTVTQYLKYVERRMFVDYDGNGHPVKNGRMDRSITIYPSKGPSIVPYDATHIMWFNK